MGEVSIIGLDLAKNVFQAHGAGADGSVVFRRKLSRAQLLKFIAAHGSSLPPTVSGGSIHGSWHLLEAVRQVPRTESAASLPGRSERLWRKSTMITRAAS